MRPALTATVAALAALLAGPSAAALAATSAQVRILAVRARMDPQALATLRRVDRVDGVRVDLAAALDVRGPALASRLRLLAEPSEASGGGSSSDARGTARRILGQRRFHGSTVPRPLHRPVGWVGRQLHRFYRWAAGALPGGGKLFWTLLAALVVGAAALVAARLGRRRGIELAGGGTRRAGGESPDPRRLEREADDAERSGEYDRALRLRFQAGLLQLARIEAIPRSSSMTNGEVGRLLDSQIFRGLASAFDAVVYGRRAAREQDVVRAREDWPRVVSEAVSR